MNRDYIIAICAIAAFIATPYLVMHFSDWQVARAHKKITKRVEARQKRIDEFLANVDWDGARTRLTQGERHTEKLNAEDAVRMAEKILRGEM